MKKALLVALTTLTGLLAYGQGTVQFANTSTTLVTTNNLIGNSGNISGLGNYRFGLYIGLGSGVASNSLVLAGALATNTPLAGRINGGNPYALPVGYPGGTQVGAGPITFQIRGWSSFAGSTYEEALQYSGPGIAYAGASTISSITPGGGTVTATALFGAADPQVRGFVLTPVPEPSTVALGLMGIGATLVLIRRRK